MTTRTAPLVVYAAACAALSTGCPLLGIGDVACDDDAHCPTGQTCHVHVCVAGAAGEGEGEGGANEGEGEGALGEGEGALGEGEGEGALGEGEGEGGEGEGEGQAGGVVVRRIERVGGFVLDEGFGVGLLADGATILYGNFGTNNATVGDDGQVLPAVTDTGGFLVVFNADRTVRWVRVIGPSVNGSSTFPGLALSHDGAHVVIAGDNNTTTATLGVGDPDSVSLSSHYVAALAVADGAIEWTFAMPTGSSRASALSWGADDARIVVAESFHGTVDVAGTSLTAQPGASDDIAVVALTPSGALDWAKTLGSGGSDLGALSVTASEVLVAIGAEGFLHDDNGTTPLSAASGAVFTLDATTGAALRNWADDGATAATTELRAIVARAGGGFLACGQAQPSAGDYQSWVVVVDGAGAVVRSTLSAPAECNRLAVDDDGTVFAALNLTGFDLPDMDGIPLDYFGSNDIVIATLDANGVATRARTLGSSGSDFVHALAAKNGRVAFTGDMRTSFTTDSVAYSALGGGDAAVWLCDRE